MKLIIDKTNLILKNYKDSIIRFPSPDKEFAKSITKYYDTIGVKELDFYLSTISSGSSILIFSTGYQVILSPVLSFELANRMILLNDKLKFPQINTVEAEEE
jgi:hypothetical protein